jgi:hypothetical protein
MIDLPAPVRAYMADRVARTWPDGQSAIDALPHSLPEGQVTRIVSDGPFGWLADARVDRIDGRIALEVLEDSRMSGPDHYRVWEDGSREELETEHTTMVFPADCSPEEKKRIEDKFYAHNGTVQELLRQRGFM